MSQGSENSVSRRCESAGTVGGAVADLPRIHLASTSPRRRELLTSAGILHDAGHPGLDDAQLSPGPGLTAPEGWVMALAYLKAASAARGASALGSHIVLGADTVVVHDGRISSAPMDVEDARGMLLAMRNRTHDVVTGVALIDTRTGGRDIFVDRASVTVGDIADAEIESYLVTGAWKGKAGAYNLSERLAAGWPITFEGDSGTIMGLPIGKLVGRLRSFAARAA